MTTDVNNIASIKAPRLAGFLVAALILIMPWLEAQALGLGEVSVTSAINEPLNADIELLNLQGLEEAELIVSLGTAADYNLAGVRYNFFHAELRFTPDFSNPSRPRVRVTTAQPVTEPYLNFVVQARWPSGRLLREYTILLDLPVFSGEQVTSRAAVPASQTAPTSTPTPRPQSTQPVNVTPSSAAGAPPTPVGSYRVQFGDTLWEIAQRVANETGITHAQAMLALRDINPEAFSNGNLNRIMSGSLLRIPTAAQVTVRDPNQARAQVANELGFGDTTPIQSTPSISASATENTAGQFRLATAENEALGSGAQGGVGESLAQVETENAVLKEELDAASLENSDLRERLAQLEEQIAVLERLVEVESSDLAQAQSLGAQGQQPVQQPAAATPVVAQPSMLDKLMGWIPWIGIGLVGILIAAYMMNKRRTASASDNDLDMDDDFEEEFEDETDEVQDDDLDEDNEDDGDDFDAGATVVLGSAPDNFDLPEDSAESDGNDDFALDDADQGIASPDEDDDTDFDDLDAFFSDIEDKSDKSAADDFDEDALIQDDEEDAELTDLEDFAVSETEPESVGGADDASDLDFEVDTATAIEEAVETEEELDSEGDDKGLDFSLDTASTAAEAADDKEEATTDFDDDNALDFDTGGATLESDDDVGAEEAKEVEEDGNSVEFGTVEEHNEVIVENESDDSDDSDDDFNTFLDDMDDDGESDSDSGLTNDEESAGTADSEELDDSIFADLGDDDLDDLLGPEGDDTGEVFGDVEDDKNSDSTEVPDEISTDTEEDEEGLSSLTAMLDNGALEAGETDPLEEIEDPLDDDLNFDLDDSDDELDSEDTLAFDISDGDDAQLSVECATKLELAEAYIDMGDESGAKILLKEVVNDGDADQKSKAQELLNKIS